MQPIVYGYENAYDKLSVHNIYCGSSLRSYRRALKALSCLVVLIAATSITILATGVVSAHSSVIQYGGGYLHGWVYGFNYVNNLIPISWANVTATNGRFVFTAYTGVNGRYEMFLPIGTYNVTVTEPGYVAYGASVAIADGSSSAINFYLEESHVPVPEFPSQAIPVVLMLALAAVLLSKRTTKRAK